MDEKECTKCEITKNIKFFYKSTRFLSGYTVICRKCIHGYSAKFADEEYTARGKCSYCKNYIKSHHASGNICNCCAIVKECAELKKKNLLHTMWIA